MPAETTAAPVARPSSPLLRLQDVDLSIDRLRARLADLESGEELRAARSRLGDAEARLAEVRLAIAEVEREQGRLEHDAESMRAKADAERRRLYDGSVANAKELQSIEAEVANLSGRISRVEDAELEIMERREELDRTLGPAQEDVDEASRRVAEIERTSARDVVDIEAALAEREGERGPLADAIEPDVLTLYEDLRRQKKGVGAASLVDGVCQACHQKLSPVYLDRLRRADGVRRCEYCRRILVLA